MGEEVVLNAVVGTRCVLEAQGSRGEKFASQFVGWIPGRACILMPPRRVDLADPLTPENEVIVRYLDCQGVLCGFRVYVQSMVHAPQRLLFLDYPRELETLRIRKQDRVECFLPATLVIGETTYSGHLIDISTGGFRFSKDREEGDGPRRMQPGTPLVCRFSFLDDTAQAIEAPGTIKDITLSRDRAVIRGVFKTQDTAARAIESYVEMAMRHIETVCSVNGV